MRSARGRWMRRQGRSRSWRTKRMAGRAELRKTTRNRWEIAPEVARDRAWIRHQWRLATDTFEDFQANIVLAVKGYISPEKLIPSMAQRIQECIEGEGKGAMIRR